MSCLFNSISYFVKENSFIVRNKICDYLQNNGKIIDGLETDFVLNLENKNYISKMRNPSVWGGAIEIQAACNIWNLCIIVKNKRGNENSEIEFLPLQQSDTTNKIYLEWTGGHYEPIRHSIMV
jgi:hypothetical protein